MAAKSVQQEAPVLAVPAARPARSRPDRPRSPGEPNRPVLRPGAAGLAATHLRCEPPVTPSDRLADQLARHWRRGESVLVTWLNHHSALVCLPHAEPLRAFTYVGVDGHGLRLLLDRATQRTSADLVLPRLLSLLPGARVAVIGGAPQGVRERVEALARILAPGAAVVAAVDGYAGRPTGPALVRWLAEHQPDVVLVALGAPLQDTVAVQVSRALPSSVVLTCGGFLDQLEHGSYYPAWAYPLRLNWLVRLAREPRRLWRRYTVAVPVAVLHRRALRRLLSDAPGYARARRVTADAAVPVRAGR